MGNRLGASILLEGFSQRFGNLDGKTSDNLFKVVYEALEVLFV